METLDRCRRFPALEHNSRWHRRPHPRAGRLRVRVPGTERTFAPKVSGVVPCEHMVWTGGFAPVFKSVRTFQLRSLNDGSTDFTMQERFSGLMLPLVKGSLPDFGPIFERYANDLKLEAESSA